MTSGDSSSYRSFEGPTGTGGGLVGGRTRVAPAWPQAGLEGGGGRRAG
jgi:hypothetical protein